MLVAKSEEIRDKYFNDGGFYETGMAVNEKMKPALEESEKSGNVKRKYTDWLTL